MRTRFAQPAILLTSTAYYRAFVESGVTDETIFLGHSIGEYGALVAAGCLSFHDGIRLVVLE